MAGEIIGGTKQIFSIIFFAIKVLMILGLAALFAWIIWYSISSIRKSIRLRKANMDFDDHLKELYGEKKNVIL